MKMKFSCKKNIIIPIFLLLLINFFSGGRFEAVAAEKMLYTSDLKRQARDKARKSWSIKNIIPKKPAKKYLEKSINIQKNSEMKPGPVKQPTDLTIAVKMLNEFREKTRLLNGQVSILKTELSDSLDKLANARIKIEKDRALIRKLEKRLRGFEKTTRTYMVKKDDCLWKISGRKDVYNDPGKWLWLYHANRDQIYDPNLIYPNMILLVPQFEENTD